MSTTPDDGAPENSKELDSSDIVVQQAAAHAPAARAQVNVHDETIVIQQDVSAESQRELVPYTSASNDSTVVRDRHAASRLLHQAGSRSGSIALWIGLGALAFAIGGGVALVSGKKGATSAPPAASAPLGATFNSTPGSAPRHAAIGGSAASPASSTAAAEAAPKPSASAAPTPELSPSELPAMPRRVLHHAPERAHSHATRRAAARPATTRPEKAGIPSSI